MTKLNNAHLLLLRRLTKIKETARYLDKKKVSVIDLEVRKPTENSRKPTQVNQNSYANLATFSIFRLYKKTIVIFEGKEKMSRLNILCTKKYSLTFLARKKGEIPCKSLPF